MQTTETTHNKPKPTLEENSIAKDPKSVLRGLRPKSVSNSSNYDPDIPRKLMEALCDTSTNTLIKLENEGIITPRKVKHGHMELVAYGIEDVQAVFKYKKQSFKNKQEAEVISVFSQKGGVGKSAFTQHLGSMLSLVGKVLIVDLDAQGDATVLYGQDANYGDLVEEEELPPTIAELMDWTLEDGSEGPYTHLEFKDVVKKVSPTLDIIPSDLDLGEINYSLNRLPLKTRTNADGEEEPAELHMIKEVFDKVKDQYDYILVDCPPNIEACNISALFATDRVVVPLELEAKSLLTMRRNYQFLERLSKLHPGFHWDKVLIVPNKFRRENIKIKALAALEDKYTNAKDVTLSQVVVTNSSIIDKCTDWKEPIFVPTTRYGARQKGAIPQAKEFTNYFWGLMHEILDLPVDRLVFETIDGRG